MKRILLLLFIVLSHFSNEKCLGIDFSFTDKKADKKIEELQKAIKTLEDEKSENQKAFDEALKQEKQHTESLNLKIREKDDEISRLSDQVDLLSKQLEKEEATDPLRPLRKLKIILRILIYSLIVIILLFIYTHKDKKEALLEWIKRRSWGPLLINFTLKYGILLYLIWEIIAWLPVVEVYIEDILKSMMSSTHLK